jgi:hypothetical protein
MRALWALRQTKKIVGLLAVVLCLEIFVAKLARSHYDPDRFSARNDKELPLSALDAGNGIQLRYFPLGSIAEAADFKDTFVCVESVALVDAGDLVNVWHKAWLHKG